jgi:hypothetical protein
MAKQGRNAQCGCGSGRKFKKCCGAPKQVLPVLTPSPEAVAQFHKRVGEICAELETYGHVKPIISLDVQGQRVVAVGRELHYSENWKTFADFLYEYVKKIFGGDWWRAEFEKPSEQRHQVVKWCVHVSDYLKIHEQGPDGLIGIVPDGLTSAYHLLAYDLYLLQNHRKLQAAVVDRLKIPDQFPGAR